jgi:hypothetical protein
MTQRRARAVLATPALAASAVELHLPDVVEVVTVGIPSERPRFDQRLVDLVIDLDLGGPIRGVVEERV